MSFSTDLLKWYDHHHRHLPWRANPGEKPNPYHVWISEIMLQQTTIPTVIDYFNRFIQKWPSIESLSQASLDDVLHMWQGLGYYSRARNLYKCAQIITSEHGGRMPQIEKDLLKLPGIGPYTAAAIISIAYNRPAPVIDGNIERILSRIHTIDTPPSQAKNKLKEKIMFAICQNRPGDFAQAMMDLGSAICTPKKPNCAKCPISRHCIAYEKNTMENYPIKLDKKTSPKKYAYVYLLFNKGQQVLIEKRPTKGLLGGMYGFPTSEWRLHPPSTEGLKNTNWDVLSVTQTTVKHTFTHFHLYLTLVIGEGNQEKGTWVDEKNLKNYAIPTLMKKVWKAFKNAE